MYEQGWHPQSTELDGAGDETIVQGILCARVPCSQRLRSSQKAYRPCMPPKSCALDLAPAQAQARWRCSRFSLYVVLERALERVGYLRTTQTAEATVSIDTWWPLAARVPPDAGRYLGYLPTYR